MATAGINLGTPRVIAVSGAGVEALALSDAWVVLDMASSAAVDVALPTVAMGVKPGHVVCIQFRSFVPSGNGVVAIRGGAAGDTVEGYTNVFGGAIVPGRPRYTQFYAASSVIGSVVNWEIVASNDAMESYNSGVFTPSLGGSVIVPLAFFGKQALDPPTLAAIGFGWFRTVNWFRLGVSPSLSAGSLTAVLRYNGVVLSIPAIVADTSNPNGQEIQNTSGHGSANARWGIQTLNTGALLDVQITGAGAVGPTKCVVGVGLF